MDRVFILTGWFFQHVAWLVSLVLAWPVHHIAGF